MKGRPVIAIAGLACETSTFTPSKTQAPAFHPKRGNEIIEKYHFIRPNTPLGKSADWQGALIGHALPGGIVTRSAFEELAAEIIESLSKTVSSTTLHGLWYDIHGAMCVEGLDDPEAELLRRIRKVIGPKVVVSASMDLHGNVSLELAHQTDLITCYRMAPHEDAMDTNERACHNLVDLLTKQRESTNTPPALPIKAWIPIPILLPGEQTSTRVEPAKHIYAAIPAIESQPSIIDAAIWVGYPWADEPRNRASIMVTGWDTQAVKEGAEHLAALFWASHADFSFVGPTGTFNECLSAALASPKRPFFISDSGDNPTAGGSGDMTWGLTKLLARSDITHPSGPTTIYASVPGPKAVQTCVSAGVGATVTVTAGAEIDNIHSGPITLTGVVHAIKHGDPHARTEVALRIIINNNNHNNYNNNGDNNGFGGDGTAKTNIYAILTTLRKPYHHESDFTSLALHPRAADIVVVKIGYLEPELHAMAADWMLALTPGGVDQDLLRLGHKRIRRPMWPFDRGEMEEEGWEPDLRARIVPSSWEESGGGEDE